MKSGAAHTVFIDVPPLNKRRLSEPEAPCRETSSKKHRWSTGKTSPTLSPTLSVDDSEVTLTEDKRKAFFLGTDECVEEEPILLEGELPPPESDESDVPIRLLQNVSIFDHETGDPVPLARLLELQLGQNSSYFAIGDVRPWSEDAEDEDEEDDASIFSDDFVSMAMASRLTSIRTSRILELSFYHYDRDKGQMDNKIYIRTSVAWYILGTPSMTYSEYFVPFWSEVCLLHFVITKAMNEPRLTYEEFVQQLPELSRRTKSDVTSVFTILGRDLDEEDIEQDNIRAFLASVIPSLQEECGLGLKRSPLIKYLSSNIAKATDVEPRALSGSPVPRRCSRPDQAKATVITPIVGQIAEQLFNNCFRVIGEPQEAYQVAEEIAGVKEHNENPTSIIWGQQAAGNDNYYTSVLVDGVEYVAGDVVMVIPGEDPNRIRAENDKTPAAQSPNQYGNQLWFCQIFYFFERNKDKLFHGQWLVHGSKTILQEAAHSKSLYLINSCATNLVASIFKRCQVRMLRADEKEPFDDRDPRSEDYHCGFCWDEEHAAFINLPTEEEYEVAFQTLPSHRPCYNCGLRAMHAESHEARQIRNGISLHNVSYHIHDFVYLQPSNLGSQLLEIAQITDASRDVSDNFTIRVRYLARYDDYIRTRTSDDKLQSAGSAGLTYDERRLYLTSRSGEVDPERLNGRCFVRYLRNQEEINAWIQQDDHFYLNQKGDLLRGLYHIERDDLELCHECLSARRDDLAREKRLYKRNGRLRGLELFSGAGGLGTGMGLSGYVETKWAVEYSPAAAKTYARNHPQTQIYCQDSSLLLKHAIETHTGKNPSPLKSNSGGMNCPMMPDQGEVDFIFGGPPCQSFSGANHHKQADDIRSTMPCNMLSYLEHYAADFFLLENVRGLLSHPLLSEQIGRVLSGGIKSGVVKFIMRTLIALGYQVHWKLLQAGQYGTPQSRERVIFWAAKRGIPLPKHPVPVYAWKRGATSPTLPIGTKLPPPTRSLVPGNAHQFAPLKPVTVETAIGDLPKFDWVNPCTLIEQTTAEAEFDKTRSRKLGIPQMDAVNNGSNDFYLYPGYPRGINYPMKPQNRYQMWMRQRMADDDKVQGHYTKRFSERLVEATTTVPLEPGADHRDLPPILQPKIKAEHGHKFSFFGRLGPDGHFACTMTQLTPGTKNARPLHPNQRRMVTVRECARAQGFPDDYIFESTSSGSGVFEDQIRQIGNAVPVPLAVALGKELGVALTKLWQEKQRAGSPTL